MDFEDINEIIEEYGIFLDKADKDYLINTLQPRATRADLIKRTIKIHSTSKHSPGLSLKQFQDETRIAKLEKEINNLKLQHINKYAIAWISIASCAAVCSILGILIVVFKQLTQ